MSVPNASLVRRIAGLALIVAVTLAVFLPLLAAASGQRSFNQLVGWANILAYSVGAASLALLVVDRPAALLGRSRSTLAQAADVLATQLLEHEGQQRALLLATLEPSVIPIDLRFERLQSSGRARTPHHGTLDRFGDFYRKIPSGRLVVLGDAGAGKTALLLELAVQLLEQRQRSTDDAKRSLSPVPVRFNMSLWNPEQPFRQWLVKGMADLFSMPKSVANGLLQGGYILPVIDGLDELSSVAGSEGDPARSAIRELNAFVSGRKTGPLVLACRTDVYGRIAKSVRDATRIRLQPLTAVEIRDYVKRELTAAGDEQRWRTWRRVLQPLDGAGDPPLLGQLHTPWRLTTAVTFAQAGGDPNDLLPHSVKNSRDSTTERSDAARLNAVLIDMLIESRTRHYAQDRYTPQQVRSWLGTVANHMARRGEHGASGADIVLADWWTVAGARRVRTWSSVVAVALTMVVWPLVLIGEYGESVATALPKIGRFITAFGNAPGETVTSVAYSLLILPALAFLAATAGRRSEKRTPAIRIQQLRTARGRRQVLRSMAAWVPLGASLGLVVGLFGGLAGAIAGGLAVGLFGGLLVGLRPIGVVVSRPQDAIRNDLVLSTVFIVLFALAGCLAYGAAIGLTMGSALGVTLLMTLGVAGHSALRYMISVVICATRMGLPVRFAKFLSWAQTAGILRTSGDSYQFRHIEIRDHLLQHDAPRHDRLPVA